MNIDLASQTVHIAGLGLMGGSLALALRGKVGAITAADTDPAVLRQALAANVIDRVGSGADADIVVVAVPADRIAALLPALPLRPGALVMDVGSTKRQICAALDHLPVHVSAVGGHPLCGRAENGFAHAGAALYQGARFVLCETARTTPAARATAEALVAACGALPLWLDRERHDHLLALTSHLPHLLSFALVALAQGAAVEDEAVWRLAAGGFTGATRLARSDAAMVAGLLTTNADEVGVWLAQFRRQLDALEASLADADALAQHLQPLVAARRAYEAEQRT